MGSRSSLYILYTSHFLSEIKFNAPTPPMSLACYFIWSYHLSIYLSQLNSCGCSHCSGFFSVFQRDLGKYSWDAILKNTNLMKRKWTGKWAAISKTISRIVLCVLLFLNFWEPLVRWLLYESLRICQSLKQSLKCLSFQTSFSHMVYS